MIENNSNNGDSGSTAVEISTKYGVRIFKFEKKTIIFQNLPSDHCSAE